MNLICQPIFEQKTICIGCEESKDLLEFHKPNFVSENTTITKLCKDCTKEYFAFLRKINKDSSTLLIPIEDFVKEKNTLNNIAKDKLIEQNNMNGANGAHNVNGEQDLKDDVPIMPNAPNIVKQLKTCRQCKLQFDLTEFYNMKTSKDGKTSICKICSKENSKKHRQTIHEWEASYVEIIVKQITSKKRK
jgi:hypothetical protein